MLMRPVPTGRRLFLSLACLLSSALAPAAPVISEFLASNQSGRADADGDRSDWIEIHNPDTQPVDLAGWHLTDSAGNPVKWRFPAVVLPAGGYLLVFASGKDRRDPTGELHANFALSADGEYLGLVEPDGVTVASSFSPAYPAQSADVSYGLEAGAGEDLNRYAFLRTPTPGAPNDEASIQGAVRFTPDRRTFSSPLAVTLEGAAAGQVIRYELAAPSEAGVTTAGPTLASPVYDGPLQLAESTLIRAAVFSADGAAAGPASSALFTLVAADGPGAVSAFSSDLPLIVLDTHGSGPVTREQGEVAAWFQLFEPSGESPASLRTAPTVAGPIGLAVRGSSSSEFPKRAFSIELRDEDGGNRRVPLLGLADTEDWALVSPWSYDPSYLRNAFAYALSNRIGRWAPRTRFVEVFVKDAGPALELGHYTGLSVLTERIKIDPKLVPLSPLKPSDLTAPAITGGYLLKLDPRDDDEFGWITARGFPHDEGISAGTMLVVASPKADDLAPAQREYIQDYVQDFEDALFADRDRGWSTRRYRDYIDVESWVDFHLLQVLTKNPDGLARSAYFHKDRGGRLKAGPVWDFDRAMGSTDPRSARWDEWYEPTQSAALWDIGWWGVLARDPAFRQAWIDRWQTLRAGALSNENLVALVAALAAEVDPAAAARDAARWPENTGRDGHGFRGETDLLAVWLTERAQWIDRQFVARPIGLAAGDGRQIIAPAGRLIAYMPDGSDPRGADGLPAPGAILVPGPLTLGEGTYTIRIYDPAAAGAFPGTPWSAPGGFESAGEPSGPAQPGPSALPQLVNLATRGLVDESTPLVCGLSVTAGAPKRYLIRAVGPTLSSFGVADALPDPVLRVLSADGAEIARNADWRTHADLPGFAAVTAAAGAFPLAESSRDAALIVTLDPGTYTVEVRGERGGRGAALAEIYALDAASVVENLSTRGWLAPGERLIGGVAIGGGGARRLLVRAIGPSLAQFGITDALRDPALAVYAGPVLIAANDDWSLAPNATDVVAAAAASGAFPLLPGTRDAALLVDVAPGAYTVQVSGKDEEGTTLIEVYDVPVSR